MRYQHAREIAKRWVDLYDTGRIRHISFTSYSEFIEVIRCLLLGRDT